MILGLDISTSCVGISIFNEDGTLMSLNYIKFKADSIFKKHY